MDRLTVGLGLPTLSPRFEYVLVAPPALYTLPSRPGDDLPPAATEGLPGNGGGVPLLPRVGGPTSYVFVGLLDSERLGRRDPDWPRALSCTDRSGGGVSRVLVRDDGGRPEYSSSEVTPLSRPVGSRCCCEEDELARGRV